MSMTALTDCNGFSARHLLFICLCCQSTSSQTTWILSPRICVCVCEKNNNNLAPFKRLDDLQPYFQLRNNYSMLSPVTMATIIRRPHCCSRRPLNCLQHYRNLPD